MMKNKRGISPLIASVLLIVFVVTIFVVIFNLTRETVESGLEKSGEVFEGFSSCDEVKFFVENAECGKRDHENFKKRDYQKIFIDIKNEKNINFRDAFVVKIFYSDGSNEIKGALVDTRLYAYEVRPIGVYRECYEGDLGKICKSVDSIEIVPRVKVGDELKFCENKKAKIQVKNC